MGIYHEDIANIELSSGQIFRSFMNHTIGSGDNMANRFGVRVFRDGEPEAIGGTCTGYFIRSDGSTVVINGGTVSGNTAYVALPEACYAVEGKFSLAIKCEGGGVTGTLRIVDGVVSRTTTGTIVDPGTLVPSIEDLIDAIDEAVASIPSDYSELSETVSELSDIVPTLENGVTGIIIDAGSNGTTESGVYNINTDQIETPLASTRHIDIDVTGKHVAYISGYFYNSNYPLWVIFDSSDSVISSSDFDTSSTAASEIVIIPSNAARMIVNCSTGSTNRAIILPNIEKSIDEKAEEVVAREIENEKTAAKGEGTIESGCWNITTHQYAAPLASTKHIEVNVLPGQIWYVAGYFYNASFPLWVIMDSNSTEIKASTWNTSGAAEEVVVIPEGAAKLIVNCSTNTEINFARKVDGLAGNNMVDSWYGKKLVWLGTSIPAGAKYGLNNYKSYPMIVGDKINATVVNEAVGESSVHCKLVQRIDATYNPYGFVENWEKCARCLTNTVDEMVWLCEHYDIKDANNQYIFTTNRPASLTQDDINFYKSCSYEIKIKSHLDAGDVDAWIFDHGHNDNQYDDNVVSGQTKTDDQIEALYGKNNLYTWQGGCNFIFTYILEADNKAKIIMIGEYDNRLSAVPPMQLKVANSWEIPIYKQWEVIGWNIDHKIKTTGYWNNSTQLWVESGGTEQEITIHDRFVRDHIHPSSDASGYATEHIAQLMAKWFVNNSLVE